MVKKRRDSGSGDAVPIGNMDESMQRAARNLGFGKRCALKSVQKRAKTESMSIWGARGGAVVTGLLAVPFTVWGNYVAVSFMLGWSVICLFFARRSAQRLQQAHEIEEFVRQQLGE